MARKGSLEAERQAIARERNALEAREAKLRESEQNAMAELLRKSALGKAPFERVEGFFAALGKLGLDEAEKRLAKAETGLARGQRSRGLRCPGWLRFISGTQKRGAGEPLASPPALCDVSACQNGQSASHSGSITTLMKLAARAMFASSKSSAIMPGTEWTIRSIRSWGSAL
jgi:hypothetical protein